MNTLDQLLALATLKILALGSSQHYQLFFAITTFANSYGDWMFGVHNVEFMLGEAMAIGKIAL